MKTRQGFVSNSSSSSFVVVGTRIPKKELEELGWYDDECGPDEEKLPEGVQCYYDEGGYIVGIPLCQVEDWGLDRKDMEQTEISEVFYQASRKIPNRPIKLMMGTRQT